MICARCSGAINEDLIEADEIGDIALSQKNALVSKAQLAPGLERNLAGSELKAQALLIHVLEEPWPKSAIDLEQSSTDAECLGGIEVRLVRRRIHHAIVAPDHTKNET